MKKAACALGAFLAMGLMTRPALASDWAQQSIQIEEQGAHGQWQAYVSLPLDGNMAVGGRDVRKPDVSLRLDGRVVRGAVLIRRVLTVSCDGREMFATAFEEPGFAKPWSVDVHSPCGTWRYTLVDTDRARRLPQGVGAIPPAGPVHTGRPRG